MNDWRPAGTIAALQRRAKMLAAARQFFAARDVLEIETPILSRHTTTEPGITSLREQSTGAWLRTSPEHHMKRLLAAGAPDIFQIGKVFRADERGSSHEPEFTMAEWYRLDYDLDAMIAETCEFVKTLATVVGKQIDRIDIHDHAELCIESTGLDLHHANAAELFNIAKAAPGYNDQLGSQLRGDRSGCLDFIVSHIIHPALPPTGLHVIKNYPAEQAMLARRNLDNPEIAERFEVFYNGLELANGFCELRDAREQRARFVDDNIRRQRADLPEVAIDESLLDALTAGLPECAGVAVGMDRVLLTVADAGGIAATLSFRAGD